MFGKGRVIDHGGAPGLEVREWRPKAILKVVAFCGLLAIYLHRIYT